MDTALTRATSASPDCAAFATESRPSAGMSRLRAGTRAPASTHHFPRRTDHMSDPLLVVIAEDNYLVREGTRRLLEDSGEVNVLAAVGSAEELLDAVNRLRPDAVLPDIRMRPGHAR